jgi:4-hydroxy-4-methyl-2-oxoglutarate aldolase
MNSPLFADQLEALRVLDACTLANAIETFHHRLRNEGFTDHSIRCQFQQLPPMLGYAATITIRGAAPPTAGGGFPDRTDWWDYIASLPEPRVVVIQDASSNQGLGALIGAVHTHILLALRCVGVVTNGSVRDLPTAESAGFHYFAGSVSVSHAYVHITGIGKPVQIGGLKIRSGDLLHGDLHGVQSIPHDIAAQIPKVAASLRAQEQEIITLCRSPEFSLQKLRTIVGKHRL